MNETPADDFSADPFSFEFERKFFVAELPEEVRTHGSKQIIVQSYVFAEGGYAIRVRITFRGADMEFPRFNDAVDQVGAYERRTLAHLLSIGLDSASIVPTFAIKSPAVNGERYELEGELDLDVATQIIRRSGNIIVKKRYSLWYNEDGWEFDVFGGQNDGLIVAECERLTPVVDLKIPEFAVTEVTTDPRFTNDSLSKEPWAHWDQLFRNELAQRGPYFLDLSSGQGQAEN